MRATLLAMTMLTIVGSGFASAQGVEQDAQGFAVTTDEGATQVEVWGEGVVRVTHRPAAVDQLPESLTVIGSPRQVACDIEETDNDIQLSTAKLRIVVSKQTGDVRILNAQGQTILAEAAGGRAFEPTPVSNLDGTSMRQAFEFPADERIYGFGQHEQAVWDYRGATAHIQQKNKEVGLPVLMSSRGYGVLWDNPAVTDIAVGVEDQPDQLVWTSEIGDAVNYYFIYGPDLDDVVRGYRALTGDAPMFARWAFGFWQCKERYQTQEELLDIAAEYRRRELPIDVIIQDWQYWQPGKWGSHEFDPQRYPDPAAMVEQLHEMDYHVLVSVWSRFDQGTEHLAELEAAGAVYEPVFPNVWPKGNGKWYDPFSADGRRVYWEQLADHLYSLGFDGFWMDATEAELGGQWGEMRQQTTALGPGARVYNAYPLMATTGVYEGHRAQTDDKRALILTRSAYPGQQRSAAVTWSGDIAGDWDIFAKQVPAGLNFVIAGIPYWNTDIGGFFGGDPNDPGYQELFTRWFQYGAFCPIFRVHGTGAGKEFWKWDEQTQAIWRTYVDLRYRLIPYIYSVAWGVTSHGDSMMRPLVMDFADDDRALDVGDQFLFGPSIMVCPVIEQGATTRPVYLPAGADWTDFWTGETYIGGQTIDADAAIDTMPLFIRAGSILPLGPVMQHTAEKPADPIELRIYPGSDADFTLYEDEGDNYNYEQGAHATIPIHWDDESQQLTIGQRKGAFPGMPETRTFHIVWVTLGHGIAVAPPPEVDAVVRYDGEQVTVSPER